jgi:Spy/CpxP family protein refolding chaperone
LDLSSEQRTKIHDIVRGSMEGELGDRLQAFGEARRALELSIWDGEATEESLGEAAQVVADLALELDLARHQVALKVLEVLTEQQREEFSQMLAEAPPHPVGPKGLGGPGGAYGPGWRRGPDPGSR